MDRQLTERQETILRFIVTFQKEMGRTPTGPEIAQHFKLSHASNAYRHLLLIQEKGYLEIIQSGHRRPISIRLLEPAQRLMTPRWPVFGSIPAGPLREPLDDIRRHIQGVEDLVGGIRDDEYFLIVEGDSMIDAGLHHGQYVLVRPNDTPRKGDICAVWIDGEGGTLKRVYREGKKVRLEPANARYEAHTYPAERVRIQGVVVATLAIQRFKK